MRRDLIRLRNAARSGEPAACLEMAELLFDGKSGLTRNCKLGYAYLQHQIDAGSTQALRLAAEKVPLEVLMAQHGMGLLRRASALGVVKSMLKLGIWLSLASETRAEGFSWIERCGLVSAFHGSAVTTPSHLADVIESTGALGVCTPNEVFLLGVQAGHDRGALQDACFCATANWSVSGPTEQLAHHVLRIVQWAATSGTHLALDATMIEACLGILASKGEVEAQYCLGTALGGRSYGHLSPAALVSALDSRRATTLLLRSAHGGKHYAWMALCELCADDTEMATFFLEMAALRDVTEGQLRLGVTLLRGATSLKHAESGVRWLYQVAEKGDDRATRVLTTLLLPICAMDGSKEAAIFAKAAAADEELGVRLKLARTFHLTKRETLSIEGARDIKPWGISVPGMAKENPKGRVIAVASRDMKEVLAEAAAFYASRSSEDAVIRHKARSYKRLMDLLAIPAEFFAEELGRTWSHYGFGRHWEARANLVLVDLFSQHHSGAKIAIKAVNKKPRFRANLLPLAKGRPIPATALSFL